MREADAEASAPAAATRFRKARLVRSRGSAVRAAVESGRVVILESRAASPGTGLHSTLPVRSVGQRTVGSAASRVCSAVWPFAGGSEPTDCRSPITWRATPTRSHQMRRQTEHRHSPFAPLSHISIIR